ncbi:putative aluminum-activated malate transporter 9-like [Capsicum annuum]|nr:putative aluminum-activated malate transporter 9-like [Capsicum annuum]
MDISVMSFSVSLDQGRGCEWGTRNGYSSLFAHKKNLLNPYFWKMIREISTFKQDVISYFEALDNNPDIDRNETLRQFIKSHGYSELFQKAYLVTLLFVTVINFDIHVWPFCSFSSLVCSTDSDMCFNLDLSLGRSTGLFCTSHSFVLP